MEKKSNLDNLSSEKDLINLSEIISIISQEKFFIIIFSFVFSLAVLIYSFSLPNMYKSEALLSPVKEEDSINSSLRNLGGLAGLAGINLSSFNSSEAKAMIAIEKLSSLSFFTDQILPNIFLPDLMAINSWNSKTNIIIYDNDLYDVSTKSWVRDFKNPQTAIPSAQESFIVFSDLLSISEDQSKNLVAINIKHQSPYIAKSWTELVVEELNNYFRTKDKLRAQAAMKYLNKQMIETKFVEVKQAIAQILQQKTQQLTLIEVSDFYVFDYVDPPVVMEEKAEPSRALICILGSMLGGFLAVIISLIRFYFFNKKLI